MKIFLIIRLIRSRLRDAFKQGLQTGLIGFFISSKGIVMETKKIKDSFDKKLYQFYLDELNNQLTKWNTFFFQSRI